METNFLYQKLCQGNRFAKIVHIGDLCKFPNYQKYFHIINFDYVYPCVRKFTTCTLSLIADIKHSS